MKELLGTIVETVEVVVDGQTITDTVEIGQVVRAVPRMIESGGQWVENIEGAGEFIRFERTDSTNYLWTAPLDDWSPEVTADDQRWELEA